MSENLENILSRFYQIYLESPSSAVDFLLEHEPSLPQLVVHSKAKYEEGISVIDDNAYDLLEIICKQRHPRWEIPVGVLTSNQNRVRLPYWMGSLDKIFLRSSEPFAFTAAQRELERWISKISARNDTETDTTYILQPKLDGVSCLLDIRNGIPTMYTRGDGTYGADITDRLDFINIGLNLSGIKNIAVRGELVFPKQLFLERYADVNSNVRNFVAGLVSNQKIKEGLSSVYLVCYEIIRDENQTATGNTPYTPLEQLSRLNQLGFHTVPYVLVDSLTIPILKAELDWYVKDYPYLVDGVVIVANQRNQRNTKKNPDYSIAFKAQLLKPVSTTVVEVIWKRSFRDRLKPTVKIEPIQIENVTISYVTAFNARYVYANGLGPGAQVKIVRSGDVIPGIYSVDAPSPFGASFPPGQGVDWDWDVNGVEIVGLAPSREGDINRLIVFFKKIGAKNVGPRIIEKLYDTGYNDIFKILDLAMYTPELPHIPGLPMKRTTESIAEAVRTAPYAAFIIGSTLLPTGIGEEKLTQILHKYPDFFTNRSLRREEIDEIPGISVKTIDDIFVTSRGPVYTFLVNLKPYRDLESELNKKKKSVSKTPSTSKKTVPTSNITTDTNSIEHLVFTGFRDTALKSLLEKEGTCKICNSFSSKVSLVVTSDELDKETETTRKAKEKNIPLVKKSNLLEYIRILREQKG